MPSVTVSQPSVIRVKVDGDSTKVKSIGYNQNIAVKDAVDVNMINAPDGGVLTYNANTKQFTPQPIGSNTQFNGDLIPSIAGAYDIGSPEKPWKSLYLTGQTMYLGGLVFSQEPETGSMAITPAPTDEYPDPKGILITPTGNFLPVATIEGKPVPLGNYAQRVANTVEYMAFTGYDAGFF